jgi:hypothetical protein
MLQPSRECSTTNSFQFSIFLRDIVFVPEGCLYFSLPCFGGKISQEQLSTKQRGGAGQLLFVKQDGTWDGDERSESRIVGSFRAVPILDAHRRDKL